MEDFNTRFNYPIPTNVQSIKDFLDSSALKDFDPVYQLAQKGAATFDMTDETAQYVNLKYNLKNGRSVYRMYLINKTDAQNMCQIPSKTINNIKKHCFRLICILL